MGDQRLWRHPMPEHHNCSLVNSEALMSYCTLTRSPLTPRQGPGGLKQKLTLQRLGHLIVLLYQWSNRSAVLGSGLCLSNPGTEVSKPPPGLARWLV